MKDDWTSVGITKSRLLGLKLVAKLNNRSVGQQLETILQEANVERMSPKQFEERIRRIVIR